MPEYSVTVPDKRTSVCTKIRPDGAEVLTKLPVEWIAARGLQLCFFAVWLVAKYGEDNVEIKKMEAASW